MDYAGFFSFVVLTAITPGPNNIMSMTNAGQQGFVKGLRFNAGVGIGFLLVMTLCALLSSLLYGLIPRIEPYMLLAGAVYILYLAYSVLRDARHERQPSKLKLNSVFTGAALQLINPKVILYGISAMSGFILPHHRSAPMLALFIGILSLIGFLSTCAWALFGAAFERLFSTHKKLLNAVMAVLLLYCALSLLIPAIQALQF